ncbi:MAG: hypothetical protein U5L96_06085 [Owenweeksia sp.]|nr:hypothetical protein [Owenweeksia sp.]
MIRKNDRQAIVRNVAAAVDEAFQCAKDNQKNKNDFVLMLSRSSYDSKLEKSAHSPWSVDNSLDDLFDQDRVSFLLDYMNLHYSDKDENSVDSRVSLNLELMIYSHIWESRRNLVNLKKLADHCVSKAYDFEVELPKYGKYRLGAPKYPRPF